MATMWAQLYPIFLPVYSRFSWLWRVSSTYLCWLVIYLAFLIKNGDLNCVKSRTFRELIVWQKAHQLTLEIYTITKSFPKEEVYGLTSQMRRAAVSVSANIAEGYKKRGKLDKARFYNISEGSLSEVEYFLILSKDLKYISDNNKLIKLTTEIAKILSAYSAKIRAST